MDANGGNTSLPPSTRPSVEPISLPETARPPSYHGQERLVAERTRQEREHQDQHAGQPELLSDDEEDREGLQCDEATPLLQDQPPDYSDTHFLEMQDEVLPSYTQVQRESGLPGDWESDRSNDYIST
ncbi:hypothetical protein HDU91_003743, partial [Kappamyces sp. JEL0680]